MLFQPWGRLQVLLIIAVTAAGFTIRRGCGLKWLLVVLTFEAASVVGDEMSTTARPALPAATKNVFGLKTLADGIFLRNHIIEMFEQADHTDDGCREDRAASLVDAGLDRICLSLDSVSDDSFRSIRKGGELRGLASGESGIEENLDFIARIYGVPRRKVAVAQSLETLGLAGRRQQLAGQLSGGWKQRLALAALAYNHNTWAGIGERLNDLRGRDWEQQAESLVGASIDDLAANAPAAVALPQSPRASRHGSRR
jgi:hypothetical protein